MPEAELIIVKVKPAKQNFKEHWMLFNENAVVYQSTDILLGLRYAAQVANRMDKPLVANNFFGTNQGSHDNSMISGSTIDDFSHLYGGE